MTDYMNRPLTQIEVGTIERIVDRLPEPVKHQLHMQIPLAQVVGGLPTFPHLDASDAVAVPDLPDGPLAVRAYVFGDNDQFEGEVLVWVENGRLSALEFAWVTDEPPATLPRPERLRFD